ncbi:unnamed protein product, partial [Vitis vinifera]|uniref:MATH domain-containing protein n=1 Tax=Vitis vinifera TaxID=29760 RepID=D7SXN2_VITVI
MPQSVLQIVIKEIITISRTLRYIQPSDYLFRVECVSSLMNTNIEKYESGKFEAGGYKWRLCLYPNGNIKSNGKGYISLYLAIADTKMLPLGWEVNVNFKLFVFNHKHDQYLTVQDAGGKLTRFNVMKTQCGFPQFLSLDVLNDPCNGYLMEDSCIFGAEVFVIKYSGKGECLSMIKEPVDGTFTWVIENFSTLKEKVMYSDVFTVEDFKWKLILYPKGSSKTKNKSLSLFLELADCETLDNQSKLYAEFELLISDQGNLGYVKHHGTYYSFSFLYSPALTHDKVTVVWFKLKSYCPSTLPVPKYSVEVKHQTKNFNHFAIG